MVKHFRGQHKHTFAKNQQYANRARNRVISINKTNNKMLKDHSRKEVKEDKQ